MHGLSSATARLSIRSREYSLACNLALVLRYFPYSTILLAGHDTTASSLTWWFWELARHEDWQSRVRDEIHAVRRKLAERGDEEFSIADLEGMSVMNATLKEAMRLHPIVWQLARVAAQDDVIPLSTPITTESGQQISSIPIRKGQSIDISIASYNRYVGLRWSASPGEVCKLMNLQ